MPAEPPLLLPATEAARLLNVSPRTLWSITHPRGSLAVVRIGSRTLYSPADLAAWIDAQKVKGAGK